MLAMSEFWHRIEIARLIVVGMQVIEINRRDFIWSCLCSRTIPNVGEAEKGSFRLCVWPWPVSYYISRRIVAGSASKSRRRTSTERSGRVSWTSGEHPDKVRSEQDAAMQLDGMRSTYLLSFSFLFSLANRSRNKSLFEGRTLEGCRRVTRQTLHG